MRTFIVFRKYSSGRIKNEIFNIRILNNSIQFSWNPDKMILSSVGFRYDLKVGSSTLQSQKSWFVKTLVKYLSKIIQIPKI